MALFIPPTHMILSAVGPQRQTIEIKPTAEIGQVLLPNTFKIDRVIANQPGRFRLYRDDASRAADLTRPAEQDADPAHGVIWDSVHTIAALSLNASPMPLGSPALPGAYCSWSWLGPLTGTTITLEILRLEA